MEVSMSDLRELCGASAATVVGAPMERLIGKTVVLWCVNYIYSGTLVAVSGGTATLDDAVVVYETGELDATEWETAKRLPSQWCVQLSAVESFGQPRR